LNRSLRALAVLIVPIAAVVLLFTASRGRSQTPAPPAGAPLAGTPQEPSPPAVAPGTPPPLPAGPAADLDLVFTAQVIGWVEPCG
jgi:hypothetical protein